jgi:hypothetical protein
MKKRTRVRAHRRRGTVGIRAHNRNMAGARVEKIRMIRNGRFYGIVTRVTLSDGKSVDFIGPMSKKQAIIQAHEFFEREKKR